MQIWKIAAVVALLVILGWGLFNLLIERQALTSDVAGLEEKTSMLQKENKTLQGQIEYFKRPENLLKELKSQFNYREAGENLIIIVPNVTSSAQQ